MYLAHSFIKGTDLIIIIVVYIWFEEIKYWFLNYMHIYIYKRKFEGNIYILL